MSVEVQQGREARRLAERYAQDHVDAFKSQMDNRRSWLAEDDRRLLSDLFVQAMHAYEAAIRSIDTRGE